MFIPRNCLKQLSSADAADAAVAALHLKSLYTNIYKQLCTCGRTSHTLVHKSKSTVFSSTTFLKTVGNYLVENYYSFFIVVVGFQNIYSICIYAMVHERYMSVCMYAA